MNKGKYLNICFMGSNQAGLVGVLALLTKGCRIGAAVSYSDELKAILKALGINVYASVKDNNFIDCLRRADLLVSVHGREIIGPDLLCLPRKGCINVHPYLYKYKGSRPVKRALKEKNFNASVGVHRMKDKVDEGDVLTEEYIDISGVTTEDEAYNRLYPSYCKAIFSALDILANE